MRLSECRQRQRCRPRLANRRPPHPTPTPTPTPPAPPPPQSPPGTTLAWPRPPPAQPLRHQAVPPPPASARTLCCSCYGGWTLPRTRRIFWRRCSRQRCATCCFPSVTCRWVVAVAAACGCRVVGRRGRGRGRRGAPGTRPLCGSTSPPPPPSSPPPAACLQKPDVRHVAAEAGLVPADKRSSAGICFIGGWVGGRVGGLVTVMSRGRAAASSARQGSVCLPPAAASLGLLPPACASPHPRCCLTPSRCFSLAPLRRPPQFCRLPGSVHPPAAGLLSGRRLRRCAW